MEKSDETPPFPLAAPKAKEDAEELDDEELDEEAAEVGSGPMLLAVLEEDQEPDEVETDEGAVDNEHILTSVDSAGRALFGV